MKSMGRYISQWRETAQGNIPLYTPEAFKKLQLAGQLAAKVLTYIEPFVQEGVRTDYLDTLCHEYILAHHAVPAPLGYHGYPKATCISVNHVICHGIPSEKTLEDGDILNIDITVILNGWYGDTSRMFTIGKPSIRARKLIDTTFQCLMEAIALVKPKAYLGDIGACIANIAHSQGFSVVEDFCGHGIGHQFHQPPNVLHYGKVGTGLMLEEGMVFTIEPMINAGKKDMKILNDGWTAVTRDKSLSAQFEHMIGVNADSCIIFTQG